MENVKFIADNEKYISKPNFNGLKVFKIENDVLTLEFGDGRIFTSPLNGLKIELTTGWGLLLQGKKNHTYTFISADGKQIKLGSLYSASGFEGFISQGIFGRDKNIQEIYSVIDSLPNTKNSLIEKVELGISWTVIAFIVLIIIIGIALQ